MRALPLACALALLAAPLVPARPQTPEPRPADTTRLRLRADSIFSRFNGTDRPGCAVGVSRSGRVLLERGYGLTDLERRVAAAPLEGPAEETRHA